VNGNLRRKFNRGREMGSGRGECEEYEMNGKGEN
jgi:hypothetical protein